MAIKFYDSPFHAIETDEDSSKLVLRADLAIMIRDIIDSKGWTQTEAAQQLGISQPRVSALVNGKIRNFSLDAMFAILYTLGFRARFTYDGLESSTIDIRRMAKKAT